MNYYLEQLSPETDITWDEFVENHPDGTLYHSSLWMKVLSRTFNYNQFSIAVRDENQQLIGILPLMLSRNPITNRKKISSLPMTTYCNSLLPVDIWKEVASFIQTKVPNIDYFEFKSIFKIENPSVCLQESNEYVNHVIEINYDPDYFFKNIFNKSLRRKINKSQKKRLDLSGS